jgi:hypothetical protein
LTAFCCAVKGITLGFVQLEIAVLMTAAPCLSCRLQGQQVAADSLVHFPNTTKPGWFARLAFLRGTGSVSLAFDRRPRMSKCHFTPNLPPENAKIAELKQNLKLILFCVSSAVFPAFHLGAPGPLDRGTPRFCP